MHRIVMGRITWVCATCGEHFTRKYSATRHNNNLHAGNGLIVTLLDYILGRASKQYLPSDPRTSKNHKPLIHDYTSRWPSKPVSQDFANNNRPYPARTVTAVITTICMKTQNPSIIIQHQIL